MTAWTPATVPGPPRRRPIRFSPTRSEGDARGWRQRGPTAMSAAPCIPPGVLCSSQRLWWHFEWPSLVVVIAAALALFRFYAGAIPVIGACGLAGLAWTLLQTLV